MWQIRRNVLNAMAFSLIELLISLTLGSLILFTCVNFYVGSYHNHTKQRELLALQRVTHQLLNYFTKHIQHIGYQGLKRKNSNYNSLLYQNKAYRLVNTHCFTFFYDFNQDGSIKNMTESKEIFGFKFEHHFIYAYSDNKGLSDCKTNRGWKKLNDNVDYHVIKLNFQWVDPLRESVLKTELTLASSIYPEITYSATAYHYLLNSTE